MSKLVTLQLTEAEFHTLAWAVNKAHQMAPSPISQRESGKVPFYRRLANVQGKVQAVLETLAPPAQPVTSVPSKPMKAPATLIRGYRRFR